MDAVPLFLSRDRTVLVKRQILTDLHRFTKCCPMSTISLGCGCDVGSPVSWDAFLHIGQAGTELQATIADVEQDAMHMCNTWPIPEYTRFLKVQCYQIAPVEKHLGIYSSSCRVCFIVEVLDLKCWNQIWCPADTSAMRVHQCDPKFRTESPCAPCNLL